MYEIPSSSSECIDKPIGRIENVVAMHETEAISYSMRISWMQTPTHIALNTYDNTVPQSYQPIFFLSRCSCQRDNFHSL